MSETIARLIELHNGQPQRAHELRLGKQVVGRDDAADVTIKHNDVSRQHVEFELTREGGQIRDLGSKNGLKLDGLGVSEATLHDEAVIALGELELRLEFAHTRVDRLLARNGEMTVRRPRSMDALDPQVRAAAAPPRSLLLPLLATVVFASFLLALMVFG